MKRFLILLAFTGVTLIMTACSVTPMFHPPVNDEFQKHEDAEAAKKLTGSWIQYGKEEKGDRPVDFRMTVTPAEKQQSNALDLHLTVPEKDAKGQEHQKDLYLLAGTYRVEDTVYLFFLADLQKACEKTNLSGWNCFLLKQMFFAVKLTFNEDGSVDYQNILFAKQPDKDDKNNKGKVLSDPSVKLDDGVVMNSSDELVKLLKKKKYFLDEPQKLVRETKPEEGKK